MSSGEQRRSARILELDARKAQSMKSKNRSVGMSKVATELDSGTGLEHSCQKRGKRKVNFRPVEELVVKAEDHQVEKLNYLQADTECDEDHHSNDAILPSTTPLPEKSKLELLLGLLQRRDTHNFFSEPVNGKEVEHYYDVIKEPMDFGEIARRLEEGEYGTLEEIEYDVYLISSNGMLFNASNTVYYRQARAIKELAKKLFDCLRTDPEHFETDFSLKRKATVRRVNAESGIVNLNSCNDTNKGCRDERPNCSEADRRWTYRPWASFLAENKTLVSAVYSSSKELVLNEETGIGYVKSLMDFAKDVGPTAAKIARQKAESCIAESLRVQDANLNCQPLGLEMQAPTMGPVQKSIRVAPSLKLPGNSVGCQTLTGEKMGMQNSILLEKASAVNTVSANDAISRNIGQTFGKMQTRGNFQGKMIQMNSHRTDLGIAFKNHMIDQSAEIQQDLPFLTHESGGGKFNSPTSDKLDYSENVSFLQMMQEAMLVDSPMPVIDRGSTEATMQDLGQKTNNVGFSPSWSWPSQAMAGSSSSLGYLDTQPVTGSSHNQPIGYINTPAMKGSSSSKSLGYFNTSAMIRSSSSQSARYLEAPAITGLSCNQAVSYLDAPATTVPRYNVASGHPDKMHLQNLGEGLRVIQNPVGFAGEGSRCGGNSAEGSVLLDWTEPMELGEQFNIHSWSQQQAGKLQSNLLGQAGSSQQQGWTVSSPPVGQIAKEAEPHKNAYEGYQSADPRMVGITDLPDNQQQPVWTVTSPPVGQIAKEADPRKNAYEGHQSADPRMVGITDLPDNQQQPVWTVTSPPVGQIAKEAEPRKNAYEEYQSADPRMVGITDHPDNQQQPVWTVTSPPVGRIAKEAEPHKNAYEGYQSAGPRMVGITDLPDNQQQPVWTLTSPPIGKTTKRAEATKYAFDRYQSADLEMVGIRGLPDNQQQPDWTVTSSIGQTPKGAGATKYGYEGYQSANPETMGIRGLPDNQQRPGWTVTSPVIGQTSTGAGATKYSRDGFQSTDPEMMKIRALLENQQQPSWTVTSLPVGQTLKGAKATKYTNGGYQSTDFEMAGIRGFVDNQQQPDCTVISPPIEQALKRARETKYAYEGYQSVDPEMMGIRCLQDSQQQPRWTSAPPMDGQVMKPPTMYPFLAPSQGTLSMREHMGSSQRQGWASDALIDAQTRRVSSVHENRRISMATLGESGARLPIDNHQNQPIVETELAPWLLGP